VFDGVVPPLPYFPDIAIFRNKAGLSQRAASRRLMSIRMFRSSSALALVPAPPGRLGLAWTMIAVTSSRMVADSDGVPRLNSSANSRPERDHVVGFLESVRRLIRLRRASPQSYRCKCFLD
jgi:hypothetical protein